MSEQALPVLEAVVPILSVTDLPQSLDYYERVLGFAVSWKSGDPPRIASICRDRVELNVAESTCEADRRTSKVYFQMAGIDAFYDRVTGAGANVVVPLADRFYGMRDFRIVDPCGNELSFGQAMDTQRLERPR